MAWLGWSAFSGFGLRVLCLLIGCSTSVRTLSADTNGLPDPASSLRPPWGQILPSFWEQYGAWIIVAGVLSASAIAFLVWLVARPKPAVPVPWSVQARLELEPLRAQPENGMLLSHVSQVLRHYMASGFGLPSEEATTSEFSRTLAACEKIGPELSAELDGFLKECDLRKFAPTPPPFPFGAVVRSLKIIEAAEDRLARLHQLPAVSAADSDSSGLSKPASEQRVASGT